MQAARAVMGERLADNAVLLETFGISRVADQTDLDVLGVPVWAAIRPAARSLSVTTGKGLTHGHAWLTAVMEAVETACAEDSERLTVRTSSIRDLERTKLPILSLDRLQKRRAAGLDPDRARAWVRGELLSGEEVWAPYEVVGLDDRWDAPWDRDAFRMSSVGLAAHYDRSAAVTAALLEAVEHDGTGQAMAWPGLLETLPRLDPATADRPALVDLLDRASYAGLAPTFLDATSDLLVPVSICLLREVGSTRSRVRPFAGCACRTRMEDAMLAALLEAIQTRATDIAGARDDIRLADYALRAGTTPEIGGPLIAVPRDQPRIEPEPAEIAGHLEAAGIGPVAIFDLSHPGADICCIAVAVPGLEDGAPGPGGTMGPRTRRGLIRRALGRAWC